MEIVKAQDTEEDFNGFVELEREFSRYYGALGVGEQFGGRVPFEDIPIEISKIEFNTYLNPLSYFVFAKEGDQYVGYLSGNIRKLARDYGMREVGFLDSVIILPEFRAKGYGKALIDSFYNWLKEQDITICRLEVKSDNTQTVELYKKQGYKIDQYSMWKQI